MSLLSSAELVQMRETADQALPGTAVFMQPQRVSDGQGGETWAYVAAGTVAARLASSGGEELELAGRLGVLRPYTLTVPADTALDETYRVQFGTTVVEIKSVMTMDPWEISRRCVVEEIG